MGQGHRVSGRHSGTCQQETEHAAQVMRVTHPELASQGLQSNPVAPAFRAGADDAAAGASRGGQELAAQGAQWQAEAGQAPAGEHPALH